MYNVQDYIYRLEPLTFNAISIQVQQKVNLLNKNSELSRGRRKASVSLTSHGLAMLTGRMPSLSNELLKQSLSLSVILCLRVKRTFRLYFVEFCKMYHYCKSDNDINRFIGEVINSFK